MSDTVKYFVVDIETDGPFPGLSSMRNLSALVVDSHGREIDEFTINLQSLPGATGDEETLNWWKTQSDIWARITEDAIEASIAIKIFADFVLLHPGQRIFVGHPLIFDGSWVSYYMQRYLGQGLMAFHGVKNPLFYGAGIDLPSFVSGALNIEYSRCRHGKYPPEVATEIPHTHFGLDDARGHADIFRKTIAERRKI